MPNVVFDEEEREIRKDQQIADARNPFSDVLVPTRHPVSSGQNLMMLLFAIVCILITLAVWRFKTPNTPIPALYKESAQNGALRFVPQNARAQLIESLPSINK
jgi:hypothetical protein